MKYAIKQIPTGLEIKIEQIGEKQQQVLESLQSCAEGRCACPTPQYAKLESIQIQPGPDGISIDLKAKAGETIQKVDIEQCLEYTAGQVEKQ